jgi:hypothetical protein
VASATTSSCCALAFALWNGRDPIVKERIFGLTGHEGNHGEDANEYWWYLDSTPTHSWMRWRYAYPQDAFPYDALVRENANRDRRATEYELLDAGAFDGGRYWDLVVDYAKAAPDNICLRVRVRNEGPDAAVIDALPTLWFRNRWSWDPEVPKPAIRELEGGLIAERGGLIAEGGGLIAEGSELGTMVLTSSGASEPLFCDNETNTRRLWSTSGPRFPKDGINNHVVDGAPTVNPARIGTKAAPSISPGSGTGGDRGDPATARPRGSGTDTVVDRGHAYPGA